MAEKLISPRTINELWQINGGPPIIYAKVWASQQRITNSMMRYTFRVYCQLESYSSWLYRDYDIAAQVWINGTTNSGLKYLKKDKNWYAGSFNSSEITFYVDVPSSKSGEKHAVSFWLGTPSGALGNYSGSFSSSFTSDALLYTPVGTPPSVSITGTNGSNFITPSGGFTVSWGRSTNGTNNVVNHYVIYIKITSTSETPTISNYDFIYTTNGPDELSHSFINESFISNNRGLKIRASVQAIGSIEGYSSSLAPAQQICEINRLPSPPIVNGKTISCKASTGNFSFSPGAVNNSGQTGTVYWSNSETGSKSILQTASNFEPGDYFFWTYDGYEFSSSYSTASILKNLTPIINSVEVQNAVIITTGLDSTIYPGQRTDALSDAWILNLNISTNKSKGNLLITLAKRDSFANNKTEQPLITEEPDKWKWDNPYSQDVIWKTIYQSDFTNNTIQIRGLNIFDLTGFDTEYAINVSFIDDFGDESDAQIITKTSDNKSLVISPYSANTIFINNHSDMALGLDENLFWYKFRLKITYNSFIYENDLVNNICTYERNNEVYNATFVKKGIINDVNGNPKQMYFDYQTPTNLTPGAQYTIGFTSIISKRTNNFYNSQKTECPVYTTINSDYGAARPFIDKDKPNGILQIFSISRIDGNLDIEGIEKKYGFGKDWWQSYLVLDSQDLVFPNSEPVIDGDYLRKTVSITKDNFWNKYWNNFSDKNKNYYLQIKHIITNVFGRVLTFYSSNQYTITFIEKPTIVFEKTNIGYSKNEADINFNSLEEDSATTGVSKLPLIENLNLRFKPELVNLFNGSFFYFTVSMDKGILSNNNIVAKNNWTTIINKKKITYSNEYEISSNGKLSSKYVDFIIPEITDEDNTFYRFKMEIETINGQTSIATCPLWYKTVRQYNGEISIQTVDYNSKEGTYTIDYRIPSLGFDSDGDYVVNDSTEDSSWIEAVTSKNNNFTDIKTTRLSYQDGTTTFPASSQDIKETTPIFDKMEVSERIRHMRLNLKSVIKVDYPYSSTSFSIINIKSVNSNVIIVYNDSPTVALRENYLGINTKDFEDTTVLKVNQTTNRHYIVFSGNEGVANINLSNSSLTGFTIDGGTW